MCNQLPTTLLVLLEQMVGCTYLSVYVFRLTSELYDLGLDI